MKKKKQPDYFDRINAIKSNLDEIVLDLKGVERQKKDLQKTLKAIGVHKIKLEEIDDAIGLAEERLDDMEGKIEDTIEEIEEILKGK